MSGLIIQIQPQPKPSSRPPEGHRLGIARRVTIGQLDSAPIITEPLQRFGTRGLPVVIALAGRNSQPTYQALK